MNALHRVAASPDPAQPAPDEESLELRSLLLMDAAARQRLDALAQLAAQLFGTGHGWITIAGDPKAAHGFNVGSARGGVMLTDVLEHCGADRVVANPSIDARFSGSVLARRGLQFFLSMPLRRTAAEPIGWLALGDALSREFGPEEMQKLRHFCARVEWELEQGEQLDGLVHDAARRADIHALTLLPHSHVTLERLDRMRSAAPASPIVVAFLELHDLERLQRLAGREVADRVLRQLADRLKTHCHEAEIGFWPKDKMLLFLAGTAAADRERLLGPLNRCLSEPFVVGEFEYDLAASVGICCFPAHGGDAATLVAHARAAAPGPGVADEYLSVGVYSAVHDSRGTAVPMVRFEMARRLKHALRHGGLRLVFQPVFDLRNGGRLASAEALLRWHDDELGDVSPTDFIPVAEQSRLILDIGEFVLRRVIGLIREWRAAGHRLIPIAANVSPTQLRQTNFAEHLAELLAQAGVEGRLLELEITEHALLVNDARVSRNLAQVAKLGVAVAIDDFGAGYSSFAHVRTLPLKLLKIDREFVVNLTESARDKQIVQAIVSMAHVLGIEVLAEGVELDTQLRALRLTGCDYVQGYLTGRPMPVEQLLDLMRGAAPTM